MKKAFTLVELLIVIAIIAMLSGVLMVSMGGGSEAARAAQCLTNMRSLANAAVAYASSSGNFPLAGSVAKKIHAKTTDGKLVTATVELPGWLSWQSQGALEGAMYPSAYASGATLTPEEQQMRDHCIANGALKDALSGSRDIIVCPDHKIAMKAQSPFFSYVMNEYFKWNDTGKPRSESFGGRGGKMSFADRRLLFAELNWRGFAGEPDLSPNSEGTDQVLQYSRGECIGFCHKKGKDKVAHVAFADGHTEQILMPKGGLDETALKKLTQLLCDGKDISFDGTTYDEMH